MSTRYLLIGLMLVYSYLKPIPMAAQPKCTIEHFSTKDGLSDNKVMYITKDQEGFMWMGTWTGITRFDGHNFVTYKSHPGDYSELKNNRIDFIAEDHAGFLWLNAYDRQVYRFDKKTGQFLSISKGLQSGKKSQVSVDKIIVLRKNNIGLITKGQGVFLLSATTSEKPVSTRFSKGADAAHQLPSDSITSFYQDSASRIWIGSSQGLVCLQAGTNGSYQKTTVVNELQNAAVTCITENPTKLWFGTSNGQLLCLDKNTGQLISLNMSAGRINALHLSSHTHHLYLSTANGEIITVSLPSLKVSASHTTGGEELLSIYEDHNGLFWMEPKENGVILFNPATKLFQHFTQPNYANYLHDADEYRVYEDNKGTVWVNMKGCGFGYFDSASVTIKPFYNVPGTADHKFSNMVSAEFFDADAGISWLSTDEGGLEKIVFQPTDFTQTKLVNNTFLKAENEVRGIFSDSQDRLWVSTKAKKIYVSANGNVIDIHNIFPHATPPAISVYTIMEDRKGNIWLGTKGDGLFKAEPLNAKKNQYRVRQFVTNAKDLFSISSNAVYTLLEDKEGRIWIGTFGGGVNLIDETGPAIKFYHAKNNLRHYPTDACNRVRHMCLDATGRIWIGTTDGLLLFDPAGPDFFNTGFVRYGKIPGKRESLGDNDVQFLYRDHSNTMWVLTSSGGLNKAIADNPMQSLKFRNYSQKDGLPSDYLLSCTEDRQGFLWIATQKGLSRFNLLKGTFQNFDAADGLPQAAFAEASCTATKSGELVFGTLNGYIRFDPARIINHRIRANIAFTNLQVNSEDVIPGEKNSPLQYAVNNSDRIILAYNQNVISIDYALLDYRSEEKESYAYRLTGFDSAWRNNKSARRVTYTNLPPNDYLFQIQTTSADLYTNISIRSLAITILPPPWKTGWAYLIYLALGILLLALVRKYALAMLKLQQHIIIERRLADLRLHFFTNVSHELRTPLTLILNPLEEIAKQEKLSAQGRRHLELVRKNARRMTRFINQLLDLRKAQSGKSTLRVSQVELVSFIRRITGYFADVAQQKEINLSVEPETDQVFGWIDAEKMDVVMYNVLGNAFKFTPVCSNIRITIGYSKSNDSIIIEITDEGAGVPDQELNDIFSLYFEGRQREKNTGKGTGIGLALSRELVQLHHGHISARNNLPQGLSVKVELKCGKTHFEKDRVVFADTIPDNEEETSEPLQDGNAEPMEEGVAESENLPQLLLVEDNSDLRLFLKNQLSGLFRVETAENGAEGLSKATALLPDVVLSDVMMPVMNGIEMLDKLKNNPATSHIPVVLLSAKFSVESQIEGLHYGADYYIAKPFQNGFLIAALQNLLVQRKRLFESLLKNQKVTGKVMDVNPTPVAITSYDEVFLQRVIAIVEEKMSDMAFNIEAVAESINMSRSPFYKKLKSLTGLSPIEFVREIRLKRSLQYLNAGEHNISLIAFEVGFNSAKYFSTCFKQRFGQTPSEYAKSGIKTTT